MKAAKIKYENSVSGGYAAVFGSHVTQRDVSLVS